jgi:hypothetical protein
VSEPLALPPEFGSSLEEFAPFLSRITAIAKYSKHLALTCMTQPLGQAYLHWLEKVSEGLVCKYNIAVVSFNFCAQLRSVGLKNSCRRVIVICNYLCLAHSISS